LAIQLPYRKKGCKTRFVSTAQQQIRKPSVSDTSSGDRVRLTLERGGMGEGMKEDKGKR